MIDGHGDDLYRYGGNIRHNFSSNIYQDVDHSSLKRHLISCLDTISNYPEPAPYSVETLLAQTLSIASDNIMVTNGAADAIHLIARAYRGKKSAILRPTFSEYADACRISEHSIVSFSDIKSIPSDADMVWICNPNNPTGKVVAEAEMLSLIEANKDKVFIVDQAYHRYTRCKVIEPCEVLTNSNLILLYSMTKDYAIPGLRLGYVVADKSIIRSLKSYRAPWSVNSLAIEAARYLLTNRGEDFDVNLLLDEVSRVSAALNDLGIATMQSDTNFILCCLPQGSAADLKDYLAETHGMLIRDASNFEGLTHKHFRIAVQRPEANDLLIKAIREWMQ